MGYLNIEQLIQEVGNGKLKPIQSIVKMQDKDFTWRFENGVKTIVEANSEEMEEFARFEQYIKALKETSQIGEVSTRSHYLGEVTAVGSVTLVKAHIDTPYGVLFYYPTKGKYKDAFTTNYFLDDQK